MLKVKLYTLGRKASKAQKVSNFTVLDIVVDVMLDRFSYYVDTFEILAFSDLRFDER